MNKQIYAVVLAALCACASAQASEGKQQEGKQLPVPGFVITYYYQEVFYGGAFVYTPVCKNQATYVGIKSAINGKEVIKPFDRRKG
jgi:hypothetical protein